MAHTTTYVPYVYFRDNYTVFPMKAGESDMYLGDDDGNVYYIDGYDDNDQPIAAWWRSKQLDFSDQFPQYAKLDKTVDRVELEYVDEIANTPVNIALSSDGGIKWVFKSRLLGTGSGKQKTANFYFHDKEEITGLTFIVKIISTSTTTKFTWTGAHLWFEPRSEYMEI